MSKKEEKKDKEKIPSQLILRPAPASLKHISSVRLNGKIGSHLTLSAGSIIYINKADCSNGIVCQLVLDDSVPLNNVLLSPEMISYARFAFGDRLEVSRYESQPPYAQEVSINVSGEMNYAKRLDSIGIIAPGLRFTDEGDFVQNVTFLPNIAALSLEDATENQPLMAPFSIFQKGKAQVTKTEELFDSSLYSFPEVVSFDDIGGLSEKVSKIRNFVELPLFKPDIFRSFHIAPPRGIILYGPSGCGKTMVLNALAANLECHILRIDHLSIVSKYMGDSENSIKQVFKEAVQFQPSVIFIDELDSIVPSKVEGEQDLENRVVSTIVSLLDNLGSNRVMVVGATNKPQLIDTTLRRPGRFDQEVEIPIPSLPSRYEILDRQFSKMKRHTLNTDHVKDIASRTHGYVGADLVHLVRECVMKCIQQDVPEVTTSHVEQALLDIAPSAMREISLEVPKVTWDDIGGQDFLKKKLREMVTVPLLAADSFARLGIKSPKGLLLYGPPGCSKTLTAKALASESGLNFLAVKGPEVFNKYVGESEKAIREIFRKARNASPSIIFFDEVDAISQDRDTGSSTGNHVLTSLLNEIDGVEELNGVVIVAATNKPDCIDPALLRPGRLDRHVYVAPPDLQARIAILSKCCSKFNNADLDINLLGNLTDGCSGAEVVLLCQEAGLSAIMENLGCYKVEMTHFEKVLENLPRGITTEMLDYYEEFSKR